MIEKIVNKPKEIRHSVNGWKDRYQETCSTCKHKYAPGDETFFPRYPLHRVGKQNENKSGHQPGDEIDHDCDHDPQGETESHSQPLGNLSPRILRGFEQDDQIRGTQWKIK